MENRRFRDCSFWFVTHSWLGLGSDLAAARVNHCIKVRTVAVKSAGRKWTKTASSRVFWTIIDELSRVIINAIEKIIFFVFLSLFFFSFFSFFTNSVNRIFSSKRVKIKKYQSKKSDYRYEVVTKKISMFYFIFKRIIDSVFSLSSFL